MLQSSGRGGGLPLSAAPPPPAGRARPDPTVFSGHSATGSSKAEAVEGKGDRRAKRQKEEARLVACGGGWQGQPLSGPRAPPTRAPACQEPAFLSVGPAVATRRMPCPPGGSRRGLGWGSSPHRPSWTLGAGASLLRGMGWGPGPLLWMEVQLLSGSGAGGWGMHGKDFGAWASLGSTRTWYLHGSPRPEVARCLGKSSGFCGWALGGVNCPTLPTPAPAQAGDTGLWALTLSPQPQSPRARSEKGGCVFGAKERGPESGRGSVSYPQARAPAQGLVPRLALQLCPGSAGVWASEGRGAELTLQGLWAKRRPSPPCTPLPPPEAPRARGGATGQGGGTQAAEQVDSRVSSVGSSGRPCGTRC